jgi:hypothetical protein
MLNHLHIEAEILRESFEEPCPDCSKPFSECECEDGWPTEYDDGQPTEYEEWQDYNDPREWDSDGEIDFMDCI